MANLNEMFPQVPQLSGWGAGMVSADQHKNALLNSELNRLSWKQGYDQDQQLNPLKLQAEQELIKQRRVSNQKSIYEMEDYLRLRVPTYVAKLAELSNSVDASELKQTMTRIQRNLMSPDKAVQEEARKMYMMTGDILKLKEQYRLAGENQTNVANIRASHSGGSGGAVRDRWQEAYNKAPTVNKLAMLRDRLATINPSDPAYAGYANRYNELAKLANEAKPGKPSPVIGPDGKITLQAPTGIIPVQPGITIPRAIPERKQEHSLADVQKMYPGVPLEQLKAAYKSKYGVDLK